MESVAGAVGRGLRETVDRSVLLDGRVPEHLLDDLERSAGPVGSTEARVYRTLHDLRDGAVARARRRFDGVPARILARPVEDSHDDVLAIATAAWCAHLLDDHATGLRIARHGAAAAAETESGEAWPVLRIAAAASLVELARYEEADVEAGRAIADSVSGGPPWATSVARACLTASAIGRGDASLAIDRLAVLLDTPPPASAWWRRAVDGVRIRASLALGDPQPYDVLLAPPFDAQTGTRYADAVRTAVALGEASTARALSGEGLAITDRQDAQGQRAVLLLATAEMLGVAADRDDRGRARRCLDEAIRAFERLGMTRQLRSAHALDLDDPSSDVRAGRDLAKLTRREREVAALVADGLTNREIAQRLVISPRTAEEHVSKILRKLGLPSRAAVGIALSADRAALRASA